MQAAKVQISEENARNTVPTETALIAGNREFSKPILSATCYTHSQLIDDVLDQYEQHVEFMRLHAGATR